MAARPPPPAGIPSTSASAVQRRLATHQPYREGGVARGQAPPPVAPRKASVVAKAPASTSAVPVAAGAAAAGAAPAQPSDESEAATGEHINMLLTQLFRCHTERVHHMAESKRIDKECKRIKDELAAFMRASGVERLVNQEEGKAFVSKVAYRKRKAKLRDCLDLIEKRDGLQRRREFEALLQQLSDERVSYQDSRITLLGQRRAGEHHPCAQPRKRRAKGGGASQE